MPRGLRRRVGRWRTSKVIQLGVAHIAENGADKLRLLSCRHVQSNVRSPRPGERVRAVVSRLGVGEARAARAPGPRRTRRREHGILWECKRTRPKMRIQTLPRACSVLIQGRRFYFIFGYFRVTLRAAYKLFTAHVLHSYITHKY